MIEYVEPEEFKNLMPEVRAALNKTRINNTCKVCGHFGMVRPCWYCEQHSPLPKDGFKACDHPMAKRYEQYKAGEITMDELLRGAP